MSDVDGQLQALDHEMVESALLTHRRVRPPVRRAKTPGSVAIQALLDSPDGHLEQTWPEDEETGAVPVSVTEPRHR